MSVVVEMINNAFLLGFRRSKIDDQHASARFQHPPRVTPGESVYEMPAFQ